jgi:hypothetical protein
MLLDETGALPTDRGIDHVRLDCISRIDDAHALWWVAIEFRDATTKPQGMFADEAEARALAENLAHQASVPVVVSSFT